MGGPLDQWVNTKDFSKLLEETQALKVQVAQQAVDLSRPWSRSGAHAEKLHLEYYRQQHNISELARANIRAIRVHRCHTTPDVVSLQPLRELLVLTPRTLRTYNRTAVPAANAIVHTRVCHNHSNGNSAVLPFVDKPLNFSSCRDDQGHRLGRDARVHLAPRPTCRVPGTSLYEPCSHNDPRSRLDVSRFCDEFDVSNIKRQTRMSAAELRAAVDLPHLVVAFPEGNIHPTNINHFSRDVLFLVSMVRHARALGWRVLTERPSRQKLNGWTRGILDALTEAGYIDTLEANPPSPRAGMTCTARAAKIDNAGVVSKHDMDELGCVMRATCNVPPKARRSLLYIRRAGSSGTRRVTNLDTALPLMRDFAERMGWVFRVINLGRLDLCEQVAATSEAAVVLSIHGADLANALFTRSDATTVEAYPLTWGLQKNQPPLVGGASGIWVSPNFAKTIYASQMQTARRRHLVARLFHVDVGEERICNPDATNSSDWQYLADCTLRFDLGRLRDLLDVLTELHAPESVSVDSSLDEFNDRLNEEEKWK